MVSFSVAGIGAASFCGVYGEKDTADSPVAAASLNIIRVEIYGNLVELQKL